MYRLGPGSGREQDFRFTTELESGAGDASFDEDYENYFNSYLKVTDDPTRPSADPIPNPDSEGLRYIVPRDATGDWLGEEGRIAQWNGEEWEFLNPTTGTQVYVSNEYYQSQLLFILEPDAEDVSNTGVEDGTPVPAEGTTYGAGVRSNLKVFADPDGGGPGFFHIKTWLPAHLVDALHSRFKESVVEATNTPPVSPDEYACYLVTATATGAWAGYEDHLAMSVNDNREPNTSRWIFIAPLAGAIIYNEDTEVYLWYNPTTNNWEAEGSRIRFQDLSDVQGDFDAGEDGYAPLWDNGTGKLVMAPIPTGGSHGFEDHTNAAFTISDLVIGNDGKVIAYDHGVGFILAPAGGSLALNDLSDVTISAPSTGQGLRYNGSAWVNGNPDIAAHNHTLDSLENVNTSGKLDKDLLQWNSNTSRWVRKQFTLDDLSDVTITSPAEGQAIVRSGGAWVNGSAVATLPSGAGVAAGLYQSTVTTPSLGSWTYLTVGSANIVSGHPCYVMPAGYTKARITITMAANSYVTTPGNYSDLGCLVYNGAILQATYQGKVWTAADGGDPLKRTGHWVSPIFAVTPGHQIFPSLNSGFVDNARYFQVEVFK